MEFLTLLDVNMNRNTYLFGNDWVGVGDISPGKCPRFVDPLLDPGNNLSGSHLPHFQNKKTFLLRFLAMGRDGLLMTETSQNHVLLTRASFPSR